MKRIFDIIFSFIGLVVLSPVFIIIAVLIKLDSPGNVFFVQERIGRNFKPFNLYKFRTMVAGAHKNGALITTGSDQRITRIGKILRKLKADEFPQLINVLKNEMSLVGPRPEVKRYVSKFMEDYKEILKVRPGITDFASLTYIDEESILNDKDDFEEYYIKTLLPQKIELSKQYIKKASFLFDLKLIILTIFRIFFAKKS